MDSEVFDISTRLFSLNPIGIGTGMIERQTSYIARLAEAHSVTVGTLVGKELALVLSKKYILKSSVEGGSRFFDTASEINGFGKVAEDCSHGLEILTGCTNLKSLTLVTWKQMIPSRGVFRETKAWCPCCLEKWKVNNQVIYEPLLWSVKAVHICIEHRVRLQNRCPNCSNEVPIMTRKTRNGFCNNCGCWLGYSQIISDMQPTNWEFYVVTNVMELLVMGQINVLHCDQIHMFFKSLVDNKGSKSAFSRAVGLPKTTVRAWYAGNNKPSLDALLIICYGVKQQVRQILEGFGNADFSIAGVESLFKQKTPKLKRSFNHDKIEISLKEIIDGKINPPPSVKEVAKNFMCDKRLLYRHYPDLCKIISEKHTAYVQECRNKRIEEACLKVKDVTKDMFYQGIHPNRRKVERVLGSKLIMREKPLQTTWREVLKKLEIQQ